MSTQKTLMFNFKYWHILHFTLLVNVMVSVLWHIDMEIEFWGMTHLLVLNFLHGVVMIHCILLWYHGASVLILLHIHSNNNIIVCNLLLWIVSSQLRGFYFFIFSSFLFTTTNLVHIMRGYKCWRCVIGQVARSGFA
jgi:hypothetical protein